MSRTATRCLQARSDGTQLRCRRPAGSTSTRRSTIGHGGLEARSSTSTTSSTNSRMRAKDSGTGSVIASAPAMVPVPGCESGRPAATARHGRRPFAPGRPQPVCLPSTPASAAPRNQGAVAQLDAANVDLPGAIELDADRPRTLGGRGVRSIHDEEPVLARGGILSSRRFGMPVHFDSCAECAHPLDLPRRRVGADEDVRVRLALSGRKGEALTEVACGGAYPRAAGIQLRRQQRCTATLEAPYWVDSLDLDQHLATKRVRQAVADKLWGVEELESIFPQAASMRSSERSTDGQFCRRTGTTRRYLGGSPRACVRCSSASSLSSVWFQPSAGSVCSA